jgi:hypothetical protein
MFGNQIVICKYEVHGKIIIKNVGMYIGIIQNTNDLPNLNIFLISPHKWKGYTLCEHKMHVTLLE